VPFSLLLIPHSVAYGTSFTWFSNIFQFFLAFDLITSHTSLRCFSYDFICFFAFSSMLLKYLSVASHTSLIFFLHFFCCFLYVFKLFLELHLTASRKYLIAFTIISVDSDTLPAPSCRSLSFFSHLFQFIFPLLSVISPFWILLLAPFSIVLTSLLVISSASLCDFYQWYLPVISLVLLRGLSDVFYLNLAHLYMHRAHL
jgi:hypothetical protein